MESALSTCTPSPRLFFGVGNDALSVGLLSVCLLLVHGPGSRAVLPPALGEAQHESQLGKSFRASPRAPRNNANSAKKQYSP